MAEFRHFLNNVYPKIYKHLQTISFDISIKENITDTLWGIFKSLGRNPDNYFLEFSKYLRNEWKIKGRADRLNLGTQLN